MDTIFSAYKHEFPPGTLDYTSDFNSLAELYHAYRDLMVCFELVLYVSDTDLICKITSYTLTFPRRIIGTRNFLVELLM